MKYSDEHLAKAKADGLALVKVEIDYRFVKGRTVMQQQKWGAATKAETDHLRKFIRGEVGERVRGQGREPMNENKQFASRYDESQYGSIPDKGQYINAQPSPPGVSAETRLYVDPNNADHLSSTPFAQQTAVSAEEEARAWWEQQTIFDLGISPEQASIWNLVNIVPKALAAYAAHIRRQQKEQDAQIVENMMKYHPLKDVAPFVYDLAQTIRSQK